MLNDDQLSVAVLLVCVTDRLLPDCVAVAAPVVTKPLALVPQLFATQGTGNAVAARSRPLQCATTQMTSPLPRWYSSEGDCSVRMLRRYRETVTRPWQKQRQTCSSKAAAHDEEHSRLSGQRGRPGCGATAGRRGARKI